VVAPFLPASDKACVTETMLPAEDVAALLALAERARDEGRLAEAIRALRALKLLAPRETRIRGALARALFYAGDWAAAWAEYEVRFELMAEPPRVNRRGADGQPEPMPRWTGGPPPGRLLVMGEQGLGDTIQFARYLPMLAARGVAVKFVHDARITALLAPLAPHVEMIPNRGGGSLSGVQGWAALLDLPRALGLAPGQFAGEVPYLFPDPARVARWRARIGAEGFKVGIVWQGNPAAPVDKARSAPLAAFAPLAAVPGVRLIALQKGPGEEQVAGVGFPVETLGPEFDPGPDFFLDTAAALACCDLYIGIDTGVLHVAGATARPAWLLLNRHGTDWRWLQGREDSVWYPTVRLIRCARENDWASAGAKAASLLRERLGGAAPPRVEVPLPAGEVLARVSRLLLEAEAGSAAARAEAALLLRRLEAAGIGLARLSAIEQEMRALLRRGGDALAALRREADATTGE
jgi:hypothetical protein